jgi:hypothetical protein
MPSTQLIALYHKTSLHVLTKYMVFLGLLLHVKPKLHCNFIVTWGWPYNWSKHLATFYDNYLMTCTYTAARARYNHYATCALYFYKKDERALLGSLRSVVLLTSTFSCTENGQCALFLTPSAHSQFCNSSFWPHKTALLAAGYLSWPGRHVSRRSYMHLTMKISICNSAW